MVSRGFKIKYSNAQNSMLCGQHKLGNESDFIFIRIISLKNPDTEFWCFKCLSWESYTFHERDAGTSSRSKNIEES